MRLLPVLAVVLGELGVGTALFALLQRTGEIRKSFFSFQSWLVAVCFLVMAWAASGNRLYQSVYFPAAIFAGLAANHFSADRPRWGKVMLFAAAFLGAFFLMGQVWATEPRSGSRILGIAGVAAGALLFGWTHGGMVLGHWYLIMQGLSYGHFQKATFQLLMAVLLRSGIFVVACFMLRQYPSGAIPIDSLFLGMRVAWGLVLPAVFGFMAWRCALTGSNQAGTGLLYITEVSVLIGEIFSGFLGL